MALKGMTLEYFARLMDDPKTRAAMQNSANVNIDLSGASIGLEGSLSDDQIKKIQQLNLQKPDFGIWRIPGPGRRSKGSPGRLAIS